MPGYTISKSGHSSHSLCKTPGPGHYHIFKKLWDAPCIKWADEKKESPLLHRPEAPGPGAYEDHSLNCKKVN